MGLKKALSNFLSKNKIVMSDEMQRQVDDVLQDTETVTVEAKEIKQEEEKIGAVNMDPIYITIDTSLLKNDNQIVIEQKIEDLFKHLNPLPKVYDISIAITESYTMNNIESTLILYNDTHFEIIFSGSIDAPINSGDPIMRLDVFVVSSNYEPIRITFYINSK